MFKLKIATNMGRREMVECLDKTLAQALEDYELSTQGAAVSLNGRILTPTDFGRSFGELGMEEDGYGILSVTVKADSAC